MVSSSITLQNFAVFKIFKQFAIWALYDWCEEKLIRCNNFVTCLALWRLQTVTAVSDARRRIKNWSKERLFRFLSGINQLIGLYQEVFFGIGGGCFNCQYSQRWISPWHCDCSTCIKMIYLLLQTVYKSQILRLAPPGITADPLLQIKSVKF